MQSYALHKTSWDYETCLAAIRGGHLEVLQWAVSLEERIV